MRDYSADATNVEILKMFSSCSMEVLGGKIDFVLHSIGMSPNVRKKRPYDDLDYDMLSKTLDISAVSFHKMIQVAKKMDAINEYGSILALSYVAAQRTLFGYNDMAGCKGFVRVYQPVVLDIFMVGRKMFESILYLSLLP